MHRLVNKRARAPKPLHSLIPAEAKTRRISARVSYPAAFVQPDIRKPYFWQRSCIPPLTSVWNSRVKPHIRAITNPQVFKQRVNCGEDLSDL